MLATLVKKMNQATSPVVTAIIAFVAIFLLVRVVGGDVRTAFAAASCITSFGGILIGSES